MGNASSLSEDFYEEKKKGKQVKKGRGYSWTVNMPETSVNTSKTTQEIREEIEDWTEKDVKRWLSSIYLSVDEKKFAENVFRKFDGKKLYDMRFRNIRNYRIEQISDYTGEDRRDKTFTSDEYREFARKTTYTLYCHVIHLKKVGFSKKGEDEWYFVHSKLRGVEYENVCSPFDLGELLQVLCDRRKFYRKYFEPVVFLMKLKNDRDDVRKHSKEKLKELKKNEGRNMSTHISKLNESGGEKMEKIKKELGDYWRENGENSCTDLLRLIPPYLFPDKLYIEGNYWESSSLFDEANDFCQKNIIPFYKFGGGCWIFRVKLVLNEIDEDEEEKFPRISDYLSKVHDRDKKESFKG